MGPPGHFGIAFAAKTIAPKAPLWSLLVASEALDLLCSGFAALGIEKIAVSETSIEQGVKVITPGSTPWSHGLFMAIIWSLAAMVLAYLLFRDRRASSMIGLTVFSHWILDFIVHLPDLPLFFENSPMVGLGMWRTGPGVIASGILEILLLAGGIAIYIIWRRKK